MKPVTLALLLVLACTASGEVAARFVTVRHAFIPAGFIQ